MIDAPPNRAGYRYSCRIVLASLVYAGLLVTGKYLGEHVVLPLTARLALAILPALAIIAMFAVLGAYLIEERDEYLRVRTVKQILIGTALSLSALTLWGFPQDAGLLPHLPTYSAACFWIVGYGLAWLWLKLFDR